MRLSLLILRALVLLIAVEISGFAGVVAEFAACSAETAADCCTDCPLRNSGKDCPPGCPACHCAHGAAVLPPALATDVGVAFDPIVEEAIVPESAAVPRAPLLPGVYRPPRPDASV